jgi:hypothetical protein
VAGVEASWSRCGGRDCVRLAGLAPGVGVQLRPATTVALGEVPPTAGRLVHDGDDLCFVPRFAFLDGTTYIVTVAGVAVARLLRARPERAATTEVLAIYPSAAEVPRNLLRLYIWFSGPMGEGYAADSVHLTDDVGEEMTGARLATEHELWDAARRRLTILLDPARIKRGLLPHRRSGYPLRSGASVGLLIDEQFRDMRGIGLRSPAERRYLVGDDQRRHVEPRAWTLVAPLRHTVQPLEVLFDRPLDHGLLARCLHLVGPDRRPVDGTPEIGPSERSWRLTPRQAWVPGSHRLMVDPFLEDLAGNSVTRVFDRDLTRSEDQPRRADRATVTFRPG